MAAVWDSILRTQLIERRHRLQQAIQASDEAAHLVSLLQQVDSTLERIDTASYGLCDGCHEHIDFWPWGLGGLASGPVKLRRVLVQDKKCAQDLAALGTPAQKEAWARQKLQDLIARDRRMRSRFDGWKVFQDGITNRYDAIEFRP